MGGSEWGAAAIGALITAVLAGIGVLIVRWYRAKGTYENASAQAKVTLSEDERKTKREDEATERKQSAILIKEYKELRAEDRVEQAENRQLIHDLRDELNAVKNQLTLCQISRARADERIAALEQALDDARIPHRKWPADDGSGTHSPAPEGGK